MYEFWCGYVKLKYEEKARLCYMDTNSFISIRLCYMDTNSFIVYIITNNIYKDIAKDFKRTLPRDNNKNVTRNIEFDRFCYFKDDSDVIEKQKAQKGIQ